MILLICSIPSLNKSISNWIRWNIVKFARGPRGSLTNQHHHCTPSLSLIPGTRWGLTWLNCLSVAVETDTASPWQTTFQSGLRLCQSPQRKLGTLLTSCTRWSSVMDVQRKSFLIRVESSAIRSSTDWKDWYHLKCVGLKTIPEEDEEWNCIKCKVR